MYHVKGEIREKCPRHPRYDPAAHGAGAIIGGCHLCVSLFHLHQTVEQMNRPIEEARRRFQDLVGQYLNRATRPKPAKGASQIAA
jgi:hypothetical protein